MKNRIKQPSLLLLSLFCFSLFFNSCKKEREQALTPIQEKVGKLNVSVDPRTELLSVIQAISEYEVIQRNNSYYNDIEEYFGQYSHSEAVTLTNKLAKIGFTYDAPVQFMLCLTQPDGCEPRLPYSDYLIRRAQEEQNLVDYQVGIQKFAKESKFGVFWKKKQEFYSEMVHLTTKELEGVDWIAILEEYFGSSHDSYNIVISPLFIGGYGVSVLTQYGGEGLYAAISPRWDMKAEVPYLDKNSLKYYLWHEFSHSFVNPEVAKYPEVLANTSNLFKPIQRKMKKQAYNSWETCVNEHIIRAINIRLTEKTFGKAEAEYILNNELNGSFVYIEPILEKLKEYEAIRKDENITFAEFLPKLLNVLDSISKTDYEILLPENTFSGPVNNVFEADKMAIIYPTTSLNKEAMEQTKSYVDKIYRRFFKNGLLLADTMATKMDLSDYGLIVYGTIHENSFLSKYKSCFPFQIEGNTIVADRKYVEENLKLITCLPNPQNPELGMTIYTATTNDGILNINNVFHGPEDYILFTDRENVLKKGFYKKVGNWAFNR